MARILLIEDDSNIAESLVVGLKSHGMMVDWFSDAKQGEMALYASLPRCRSLRRYQRKIIHIILSPFGFGRPIDKQGVSI